MNLTKPITTVVVFTLFVFSSACNHAHKPVDKYAGFTETDKIVNAVITERGLPVKKGDEKHAPGTIIIGSLNRIYVSNHNPNDRYPSFVFFSHLTEDKYFKKSDSAYLFNQNNGQKSVSISNTFQKQLNLPKTTPATGFEDDINMEYKFTIPLYSKDGKTVFICVTTYCGHCMYTNDYFLKKSKDTWHVVAQRYYRETEGN